jgi:hypothetical protein
MEKLGFQTKPHAHLYYVKMRHLKIAQRFSTGTRVIESIKVPPGTKEIFCRP